MKKLMVLGMVMTAVALVGCGKSDSDLLKEQDALIARKQQIFIQLGDVSTPEKSKRFREAMDQWERDRDAWFQANREQIYNMRVRGI